MTEIVRRLGFGLSAAALVSLMAANVSAQSVTGSISGTIVDEQRQVIPGATVTAINELTNESRVVTSSTTGTFLVTNLPPGSYTVRVEMQSFRTAERTRNVLSAAERMSIGVITLAIGGLGETVTVEASGTRVNPAETQHSGLITSRQIEQIQVKARDVTSLMRILPGVRYEDNVEALGDSFGTLVPHVGGQRRDWNTIMVDGVLGNEIGQANRMAQQINLDAIAEIKVLLNTYRAEYGRTGGAQAPTTTAGTRTSTPTTSSTTGRTVTSRATASTRTVSTSVDRFQASIKHRRDCSSSTRSRRR
jgi:Carboxypeptidase regulatory-like domain/TonB-dependent Receptor Plug Domain